MAFATPDDQGTSVQIILEAEGTGRGLKVIGVLHTKDDSSWSQFAVVMYRGEVIEDFAEASVGEDFELMVPQPDVITLKFVSSAHRVIFLRDLEVDLD
ncbi:MAG: hypothetical protein GYB67_05900 [Chloroflexi bacterium]|nr:hypothetical protein [Chloroflexota bacterium]